MKLLVSKNAFSSVWKTHIFYKFSFEIKSPKIILLNICTKIVRAVFVFNICSIKQIISTLIRKGVFSIEKLPLIVNLGSKSTISW